MIAAVTNTIPNKIRSPLPDDDEGGFDGELADCVVVFTVLTRGVVALTGGVGAIGLAVVPVRTRGRSICATGGGGIGGVAGRLLTGAWVDRPQLGQKAVFTAACPHPLHVISPPYSEFKHMNVKSAAVHGHRPITQSSCHLPPPRQKAPLTSKP